MELLVVILIVGILAAVAAPIYLGYVRDARITEGKVLAGILWDAVLGQAQGQCGSPVTVRSMFTRAGFSHDGVTNPPRWAARVGGGGGEGEVNTLLVGCMGEISTSATPLFVIEGVAGTNVEGFAVGFFVTPQSNPPRTLRCQNDGRPVTRGSPVC